MSETIRFFTPQDLRDVLNFTRRLRAIGAHEMSLEGVHTPSGALLAVTGPVLKGQGILDTTPLVLGMRAIRVAEIPDLRRVIALESVMERVPRLESDEVVFPIPPGGVHAPWAGISPPVTGWQPAGQVSLHLLRDVARQGQGEIAAGVGDGGAPEIQINRLRSAVWGRNIQEDIPAGAAFGAEVLGFLGADKTADLNAEMPVWRAGKWLRIVAPYGVILVRAGV